MPGEVGVGTQLCGSLRGMRHSAQRFEESFIGVVVSPKSIDGECLSPCRCSWSYEEVISGILQELQSTRHQNQKLQGQVRVSPGRSPRRESCSCTEACGGVSCTWVSGGKLLVGLAIVFRRIPVIPWQKQLLYL